jgi:hypothetical protein
MFEDSLFADIGAGFKPAGGSGSAGATASARPRAAGGVSFAADTLDSACRPPQRTHGALKSYGSFSLFTSSSSGGAGGSGGGGVVDKDGGGNREKEAAFSRGHRRSFDSCCQSLGYDSSC